MKTILFLFLAINISLMGTACVDDSPYIPRDSIKPEPMKHAPLPPPPPVSQVEEMLENVNPYRPRFPGCELEKSKEEKEICAEKKLFDFVYKNLVYPKIAKAKGIEGTVKVSFIVEKDGKVSTVKIVEDIGGDCGKAAIHVIELMNKKGLKWVITLPSRMRAQRVLFELPIVFKLSR